MHLKKNCEKHRAHTRTPNTHIRTHAHTFSWTFGDSDASDEGDALVDTAEDLLGDVRAAAPASFGGGELKRELEKRAEAKPIEEV